MLAEDAIVGVFAESKSTSAPALVAEPESITIGAVGPSASDDDGGGGNSCSTKPTKISALLLLANSLGNLLLVPILLLLPIPPIKSIPPPGPPGLIPPAPAAPPGPAYPAAWGLLGGPWLGGAGVASAMIAFSVSDTAV
jgi:hypothetical protein